MSKNGQKSFQIATVERGFLANGSRFMLGNIASLWGDLISIDERSTKPSSFYKAYFQILTNVPDRINDTVELKVASKVFKVRVCEFDPCFTPNSTWCLEEEESNFSTSDAAIENNKLNDAKGSTVKGYRFITTSIWHNALAQEGMQRIMMFIIGRACKSWLELGSMKGSLKLGG
ncbi:hypothetical protein V6N11_079121 [Hibiscus sabdariffa]|uniref:Uncharacterized protein n=1 Tax=Hibiscus sabdariffa TaxID=183260 RepID=A0ABR2RUZ4_9ROSI